MLLSVEEVPLSADVHFAHNPELNGTRSVLRPLSARETMSRAKAVAARMETPGNPPAKRARLEVEFSA